MVSETNHLLDGKNIFQRHSGITKITFENNAIKHFYPYDHKQI